MNGFDKIPIPNFSTVPTGEIGHNGINISGQTNTSHPDPFAWMESKYGASKELLNKHQSLDLPANIHTSSDLIGRDDYISAIPKGSTVNMHMLTGDPETDRILFPGNPSSNRLMSAADKLKDAGIKTNVIQPTVEDVLKSTADRGMDLKTHLGVDDPEKFLQERGLLTDAQKKSGNVVSLRGGMGAGFDAPPMDINQYLKNKQQPSDDDKPPMDVSQYLKEKTGKSQGFFDEHPDIKAWTKAGLETLPTAGAVGGGLIGGAAGTAAFPGVGTGEGAIAGAGLGGAAGKGLEQLGKHYLLGEDAPSFPKAMEEQGNAGLLNVAGEAGGQAVGAGAKAASETPYGQKALGLLNDYVAKPIGKALSKSGEALSGVPEKEIQTYANNADEVNRMARESGNNPAIAANQSRNRTMENIRQFKKDQYGAIEDAVAKAPADVRTDVSPVVEALEKQKAKYNANTKTGQSAIGGIDDLINEVNLHTPGEYTPEYGKGIYNKASGKAPDMPFPSEADTAYGNERQYGLLPKNQTPSEVGWTRPDSEGQIYRTRAGGNSATTDEMEAAQNAATGKGDMRPSMMKVSMDHPPSYQAPKAVDTTADTRDLNRIKNYLQDEAEGAYSKNGEVFNSSSPKAKAARTAAANARELLNNSSPDIAAANSKLSKLHDLDEVINSNLIGEDKSYSGLLAAGSGQNKTNEEILRKLDELVGSKSLSEAQKLAAMRTFGSPKLMPMSSSGTTSTSRSLMGPGAGAAAGMAIGGVHGAGVGAVVGGALTSPRMVKTLIDSGLVTKDVAAGLLKTPQGRSALTQMGAGLLNQSK